MNSDETRIGTKRYESADLFCGAGGLSHGFLEAAKRRALPVHLTAVNHWTVAISSHRQNHPAARHICQDIQTVKPHEVIAGGGRLDFLGGAPECIFHSKARGGKPINDQRRSSAWEIIRWVYATRPRHVLLENVKEFADWGPLFPADHPDEKKRLRPDPAQKGTIYRRFIKALENLGYAVDARVLNAADFGDATTRERLFIQARRGSVTPTWPKPTHRKPGTLAVHGELGTWRPAREIIDWTLTGRSIYGRKKPLAPNTMRRILVGLEKFSGLPFIIPQQSGGAPRQTDNPLPTIAQAGAISLVQPFLVVLRNNCDAQSVDAPLPTLCAGGHHFGLAEPYVIGMEHSTEASGHARRCRSLFDPLPTLTTRPGFGLAEPFIMVNRTHGTATGMDEPLKTLTTGNNMFLCNPTFLCDPCLMEYHGGRDGDSRTRTLDSPLPTVDTSNRFALLDFLVSYYGTGGPQSVDAPLPTVTTRDRFALVSSELVTPQDWQSGHVLGWLDIRFRMLQPQELAGAMGFPKTYHFHGSSDHQVAQIGNAVPVTLSTRLWEHVFEQHFGASLCAESSAIAHSFKEAA